MPNTGVRPPRRGVTERNLKPLKRVGKNFNPKGANRRRPAPTASATLGGANFNAAGKNRRKPARATASPPARRTTFKAGRTAGKNFNAAGKNRRKTFA